MARTVFRRGVAWTATFAFLATLGLPIASSRHLMPDDDPACVRTWQSPHPISQFEPVREPVSDGHCAVCHWLRALGASVTSARLRCPLVTTISAGHSSDAPDTITGVSDGHQARAPPALSFVAASL